MATELARCHTATERKLAKQWILDYMLLPIGRVVVLRDLASRPGLNGEPAIVAACQWPHRPKEGSTATA